MKILPNRLRYFVSISALTAAFIFLAALLGGCNKVSHNGDLDGQWRILYIENTEDGKITEPVQYFYCFYLHTANLTRGGIVATANMTYEYPLLSLDFPYASLATLSEWGITTNPADFEIVSLSRTHLIMKTGTNLITLRKF
ncbi:MAG: lipocalin-like domain-containing protein [Paramuribaculum sp.]|nr:lipocalin-like domain-containing protein [Paramuribaculum sp.]